MRKDVFLVKCNRCYRALYKVDLAEPLTIEHDGISLYVNDIFFDSALSYKEELKLVILLLKELNDESQ